MKKTYCTLIASILLLPAGCDKGGEAPVTGGSKKIGIITSISAEGVMRSPQLGEDGSGNFSTGDVFSLMAISESGDKTMTDYKTGSTVLYWDDIAMGQGDRSISLSACYPRQDAADGRFTFDLKSAEDKDLLWASASDIEAYTEKPVTLTFKHVMHRLIVNISTDPETGAQDINTQCTAKYKCDVDLAAGTFDNSATGKETFSATGQKAVFTLVPQPVSEVSLSITVGDRHKTLPLEEIVKGHENLESGMQLTVNITVKNGNIQVDGTTIEGWGDQGTIDGEIIM